VEIRGLDDPRDRVLIMERNIAFESDANALRREWESNEQALSDQIGAARELVETVSYSRRDLLAIAALTSSFQVDGHRSDLVILKAARAHAAFEGRHSINQRDIALAAELALPHRLRRGLFQEININLADLQAQIEQIQAQSSGADSIESVPSDEETAKKKRGQRLKA
jgi:Mg-chelatase subunit ChlI